MAHTTTSPVSAGSAAGLVSSSCLAADGSENTHSQSAPQEATAQDPACDPAYLSSLDQLDAESNLVLAAPAAPEQPNRALPVIAINVRLKQLRELAKRRCGCIDAAAWLAIYAEGLARRYGGMPLKSVLIRDAKGLRLDFDADEIDEAVARAVSAYQGSAGKSAWSAAQIGRALSVTLKERMTGLTHLGCCEETEAERNARRKSAKKARNAARYRRTGTMSVERLAPWNTEGVSHSSKF